MAVPSFLARDLSGGWIWPELGTYRLLRQAQRSQSPKGRRLEHMANELYNVAREPPITAALWLVFGVVLWRTLSKRTRIAAISALGGVLGLALGPAFAFLGIFGSSILVGLAQSALLWAFLTVFFAPLVLAIDRLTRTRLLTIASRKRSVAYLTAAGTGLLTSVAALAALWWLTDVRPELVGSVELAVFGGVVTACLALVRADRQLQGLPAPPGP